MTLLSRWRLRWRGAPRGAVDGRRGIGGRGRQFSVPRRGRRGYFARRARSDVPRRGDRIKCLGLRTDRTSCINATDSICRRARMESQSVVKLDQWARVENAPKKAQLSKGRREAAYPPPQAPRSGWLQGVRSRPPGPAQIESVALCVWQCHLRDRPRLTTP